MNPTAQHRPRCYQVFIIHRLVVRLPGLPLYVRALPAELRYQTAADDLARIETRIMILGDVVYIESSGKYTCTRSVRVSNNWCPRKQYRPPA